MLANHNSRAWRRLLVVRLGSMGDVIHTLPAVAALHRLFPAAEIGWVIEERWAELLRSPGHQRRSPEMPLVDCVHVVNTRAWRSQLTTAGSWQAMRAARRELRQANYDVALDFQGAWKSAVVSLGSGAPVRIGFRHPREPAARWFYTRKAAAAGAHVVEQGISLLTALLPGEGEEAAGLRLPALLPSPPAPELPRGQVYESWAEEQLASHKLSPGGFAVLNPGAGWGAKCWAAESYGEVARGLAKLGLPSFLNCGPGEEALAQAAAQASRGAAWPLRSSLSELIALMRRARIFVGGDTGPMHLAAALEVPVVGIFGPTDPARNGPYATQAIVLRSAESVTNHSRRAKRDDAMLSISPAAALEAAARLLRGGKSCAGGERA
jgi:heptosyltransferase-1